MISWIKRLTKRFFRPVDWQFERYMAGATDRADLEYRMRAWARRGLRAYIAPLRQINAAWPALV